MGVGHCIKNQNTICHVVAKAHIWNIFVMDDTNTQLVKSNSYRYKNEQKDKAIRNKTSSRIDGYIKKIEDDSHTPLQMAPMIHMENATVEEYTSEDTSDNESTSVSE